MDFSQFLPDVLSSLTVAAVIGGIAWIYSWTQNIRLERALKGAINPNGVGMGLELNPPSASFNLQIHNYTNAYIRVRTVVLFAEKWSLELVPEKAANLFQTPLSNEVAREKFPRVFISRGALEEDSNPHSRVLPPKTMGIWEVAPHAIGQQEWKLTHGVIVFEYGTIFGNVAMVRMKIPEPSFKMIKECFEELSTCVRERRPFPHPFPRAGA